MSETYWKVENMAIGDFIEVQVMNKKGDKNLDGMILRGIIKELSPSHNMVKLHTGWCCHTKDKLLKHVKKSQMSKLKKEELLKDLEFVLATWKRHYPHKLPPMRILQIFENFQQIKEMIQKKHFKLHEANIKWIEDIIDIVMESVSCDHSIDHDGAGKSYDSVSYSLNYEQDVIKKCVEAIPEVELKLDVDDQWIIEKGCEASRFYSTICRTVEDSRNFIRSFIKELQEKIK